MVELIWDGKYDAQGRRVAPLRLRLPFQTVETVNESAELRQRSLFGAARQSEWRYIKVPQKEFESLQPDEFEDLIALEPIGLL